jgi:hypothetical protein
LINATRKNLLSFRQQPINETNLILFGQALRKAINTLHRQKTSCSANLDRTWIEFFPSHSSDALYQGTTFSRAVKAQQKSGL